MVASHGAPYWEPDLQPRHVPWLGIEPVTLRFAGWRSIHWATSARAVVFVFFFFYPSKTIFGVGSGFLRKSPDWFFRTELTGNMKRLCFHTDFRSTIAVFSSYWCIMNFNLIKLLKIIPQILQRLRVEVDLWSQRTILIKLVYYLSSVFFLQA